MELHEFLMPYKKAALIYRGGLCSAYLLYAAAACRVHIAAYMVDGRESLKYAVSIAKALGAEACPLAREPERTSRRCCAGFGIRRCATVMT